LELLLKQLVDLVKSQGFELIAGFLSVALKGLQEVSIGTLLLFLYLLPLLPLLLLLLLPIVLLLFLLKLLLLLLFHDESDKIVV
jgi:hypothetical protein